MKQNTIFKFLLLASFLLPACAWADVTVTPAQLNDEIKTYIQESTPLENAEATLIVEPLKLPAEPIVLKGKNLRMMLMDSRNGSTTFRTIVQVVMTTDAETRQIGVPIRIGVEKPVWVVTKFVHAKEPLSVQNVVKMRKQLMYDAPYAVEAKQGVSNYTSRINLTPGTVLDERNVNLTPLVFRNEDVHMVMAMGNGVTVSVFAKALEDGGMGKSIRVCQRTNNNKAKYYTAEVIDRNTVVVKM